MATQPRELPSQVIAALAVLVASVITAILLKAPHTLDTYIVIAPPYMFLFATWNGYHALSGALDAANVGSLKNDIGLGSASLRERAGILATFGLLGIAIAVCAGFILGRMAAH
jgi:hypothetical protein